MLTIAKFGGSSLADGRCFQNVRELISADPARKGIVVSAPGRRFPGDTKVTDLLYDCYAKKAAGGDWKNPWQAVAERFLSIEAELHILPELAAELTAVERMLAAGTVERDALVSRGEYFSARLLAALLGYTFVDSTQWLRFTADGKVDTVRSYGHLHRCAGMPFVTPGFYGVLPDGRVHTFTRGGSDITGSLVAAALDADLYENWTDVPGVLTADPAVYPAAKPIPVMTYGELTELSRVGTQVLHEDAVAPVREAGIPMRVLSTREPNAPGTTILPLLPETAERRTVLSVTGRRDRVLLSGHLPEDAAKHRDFYTEVLGNAAVSLSELPESGSLSGLTVRDSVALVAVVFAENAAKGPCVAELLMALHREQIPVLSILRPYGGHTLLLSVPDEIYPAAVCTLCRCTE